MPSRPQIREEARRHRRRRLHILTAIAALSGLAGVVVGAGAGEEAERPAAPEASYCRQEGADALLRAAGQGVVVRMTSAATLSLRGRLRRGEIGGVILFPAAGIPDRRLAAEVAHLRSAAVAAGVPPPLVMTDQEGGPVKRFPALAPRLSPHAIAQAGDAGAARLEGAATGAELRDLGVDVNLAPVLDVPSSSRQFIASRAFGFDPSQVTDLGLQFAASMQGEGVAATAKHFPGLGRAAQNTDLAPTAIAASRGALRSDLEPFRAAVAAGVRLVMVASAAYPTLGADGPASLSPAVVTELLRGELGYDGVVITDDLLAPAVSAEQGARQAALAASQAGVDVMLYAARDVTGVAEGLAGAARRGRIDPEALRLSCERVTALKDELATGEPLG